MRGAQKLGEGTVRLDKKPSPLVTSMQVTDLPTPPVQPVPTAADMMAGPPLSPQKRIWLYDSDEWEQFILEWAGALREPYKKVQNIGGPGDRGIDVVGFLSPEGFEGEWDCFQCKHYIGTLNPNDAWPEMLKIILFSMDKYHTLPRQYYFMSPKGCGPKLGNLINTPTELREQFLDQLANSPSLTKNLDSETREKVYKYAKSIDYSIFDSISIEEVLETHRKSRYHALRFGVPLQSRPKSIAPPSQLAHEERRYVEQLMEVYSEKYFGTSFTPEIAREHQGTASHFPRQRESFYCAESLRLFARDNVPEGTFEKLQDDVYTGIVDVEERDFPTGYERLSAVLQAATQIDLSFNALISVSDLKDRKGICHHLANEDRITWIRRGTT